MLLNLELNKSGDSLFLACKSQKCWFALGSSVVLIQSALLQLRLGVHFLMMEVISSILVPYNLAQTNTKHSTT